MQDHDALRQRQQSALRNTTGRVTALMIRSQGNKSETQ
jgi:hypothetical protein